MIEDVMTVKVSYLRDDHDCTIECGASLGELKERIIEALQLPFEPSKLRLERRCGPELLYDDVPFYHYGVTTRSTVEVKFTKPAPVPEAPVAPDSSDEEEDPIEYLKEKGVPEAWCSILLESYDLHSLYDML